MNYGSTKRQMQLLRYIQGYQEAHGGVSPSFEEMGAALGYVSKSVPHNLLNGLEKRGKVRRLKNRARAIEILRPVPVPRFFDGSPMQFIPLEQLVNKALANV